jgi:hypothetical protein
MMAPDNKKDIDTMFPHLVALEVEPEEVYAPLLQVYVAHALKSQCPGFECMVGAHRMESHTRSILDMTIEVSERALAILLLQKKAVSCTYVAQRRFIAEKKQCESVAVDMLMMAVRDRERIIARYLVPIIEEGTPDFALTAFQRQVESANKALPGTQENLEERAVANLLTDAVTDGFTSTQEHVTSTQN